MMTVPWNRFPTSGANLNGFSKVVAKVGDIFKNHEYVTYARTTSNSIVNGTTVRTDGVGTNSALVGSTNSSNNLNNNNNNHAHHHHHYHHHTRGSYNGRVAEEAKLGLEAILFPLCPVPEDDSSISDSDLIVQQIARHIEMTLKEAKQKTLGSCRVLIPTTLVNQIAMDIVGMSENEPCGLRGCQLYISFEDRDKAHGMGQVKFGDRTIVPTFEMYLYLKRNVNHWYSMLPGRLLSKFGRETVVISECYKLSKKKLFRSMSAP